jgi:hypothetical protein
MPGIAHFAKATNSQLEAARYEPKHAVKLGDEGDGRLSPIVALLKLVMIRTFTTIEDINPDWTEGINKLLNELTARAPIASTLCNKDHRNVQEGAPKRANTDRWYRSSNGNRFVRPSYVSGRR